MRMSDYMDRYDPDTVKFLRDTQYNILSTNLAEVGTDTISRQAAIDALRTCYDTETITMDNGDEYINYGDAVGEIEQLPPEIICCKDCEKHNKGVGDFEITPDGKRTWIWKDRACPLVSWRGKAQGHEFDYQFCAYGKKREVTT